MNFLGNIVGGGAQIFPHKNGTREEHTISTRHKKNIKMRFFKNGRLKIH